MNYKIILMCCLFINVSVVASENVASEKTSPKESQQPTVKRSRKDSLIPSMKRSQSVPSQHNTLKNDAAVSAYKMGTKYAVTVDAETLINVVDAIPFASYKLSNTLKLRTFQMDQYNKLIIEPIHEKATNGRIHVSKLREITQNAIQQYKSEKKQ